MVNALEPHLKGKSVLLTGHTGFKGSWMALWLASLGARVHGYSLAPPTSPSNYQVSRVREVLAGESIADIRDAAAVTAAVQRARPDIIFHMAAQPLVRDSYNTPRETFDINVMGTASLLDAVRAAARPCVVIAVTSDKCYENQEQTWGYRECDPMGGFDPYSASKGACELLVSSYRRAFFHPHKVSQHGIKLASARAGNVIGGGDWARDRILVDAVLALVEGNPIPVRNPNAIRPWQHVLEPLSGYLSLAAKLLTSDDPIYASGWNFGPFPGAEAPVRILADLLCSRWGKGASWKDVSDPHAPHEAGILRLSIDKAVSHLAWRPRWNLDRALLHTAEWYRTYYESKPSMNASCLSDITAYLSSSGEAC